MFFPQQLFFFSSCAFVAFVITTLGFLPRFKVEISDGLGPTVGKILRVGLMGINAQPRVVDLVLRALDEGLKHAVIAKI